MGKIKQTSFNVDEDLMWKLKVKAAELKTTQTDLIHRYLREGIERDSN